LGEVVVIGAVQRAWDRFRGGGEAAVTVPSMDGALRPNRLLEEAPSLLSVPGPDNLVTDGSRVLFSSGGAILELDADKGAAREVWTFEHPVTALALASDGTVAAGLDDGRLIIQRKGGEETVIHSFAGRQIVCPTALRFASPNELLVAQGSVKNSPRDWKTDLMERGATGSVWKIDLATGEAACLRDQLAWPYGLADAGDGGIAVTESWRHRIVVMGAAGGIINPVLEDLPGYPARLSPAADGGFWLSVFAPRNQLIEFILRESEFRRRMMAEIDSDYWAAPSLRASATFLEPLQGGAQKQLGMLKPWAPTRSYGLVIRLDRNYRPVASFHSRADGSRHGVTSAIENAGRLLVSSKGGDEIIGIENRPKPNAPDDRGER
jgi:hypothetical protein